MGLILVRHTTPDIAPGICYGQTDLDVTQQFPEEAAAVLASLPPFARIVTSPLIRCRKLAEFIGKERKTRVDIAKDLIEMDFGTWEGEAWDRIPREDLDAWAADFLYARPHGGENVASLRKRVTRGLAELRAKWKATGEPCLVVTHSGVIRAALATGDTAKDFDAQIDFGGFVILCPDSGGRP